MLQYKGEMMVEHFWGDFFNGKWFKAFFNKTEQREQLLADIFETHFPEYLRQLDMSLGGSKYLVGDSLTIYDMHIAGHFYNLFLNPNAVHKEQWAAAYAKASDKVKAYIEAFGAEMKGYLDSRVSTCTM